MNDSDWKLIHAFERGVDDGFFRGEENPPLGRSDDERVAYKRGYEHGVWMFCEAHYGSAA